MTDKTVDNNNNNNNNNNNQDLFDEEPPPFDGLLPSYAEATGNSYGPPHAQTDTKENTISSSGSTSTSQQAPPYHHSQQPSTVSRQFPASINLYNTSGFHQRLFLAEHKDAPLYAIKPWFVNMTRAAADRNGGSRGSTVLALFNGPTTQRDGGYAPLATVVYSASGRRMSVRLPLLPGQTVPEPVPVQMPSVMSTHATFSFQIEVPWGPTAAVTSTSTDGVGSSSMGTSWRRETFEWRRSSSDAVSDLGGSSHGFKLVRMSNDSPAGGQLPTGGRGPSCTDGHEIVAVCASAVKSLTKRFKFSFLGTGVSGVLGERWAVMAVTTGLVVWDWNLGMEGLQ